MSFRIDKNGMFRFKAPLRPKKAKKLKKSPPSMPQLDALGPTDLGGPTLLTPSMGNIAFAKPPAKRKSKNVQ